MFVHHVFFWLKEGLESAEIQKFEETVKTLPGISHVKFGDVGKAATTNRPVIERSYSYSLLLVFESEEKHDSYQVDPIHDRFVSTCSSLWTKVLIYDSETL
jgi:Stress responsive A/B Barrel Domain